MWRAVGGSGVVVSSTVIQHSFSLTVTRSAEVVVAVVIYTNEYACKCNVPTTYLTLVATEESQR